MIIEKKNYCAPKFNRKEILRYAQCESEDDTVNALVEECLEECRDSFIYKVCWCELPITLKNGKINLNFFETDSTALLKNLSGCEKIILFGATVGIEIDRLISKYSRISPAKAVVFQAIGAERIEALCNAFNAEIAQKYKKENLCTRPRFSPGYGDFPITAQSDIFRILDCSRKIGIFLNESLLMSPSKSVTAIIGLSDKETECRSSCEICKKTDCVFRR